MPRRLGAMRRKLRGMVASSMWRCAAIVCCMAAAIGLARPAGGWSRSTPLDRWSYVPADTCPEVFFLGVRGSGQTDTGPKDPYLGMGPQVVELFRLYRGAMVSHFATN